MLVIWAPHALFSLGAVQGRARARAAEELRPAAAIDIESSQSRRLPPPSPLLLPLPFLFHQQQLLPLPATEHHHQWQQQTPKFISLLIRHNEIYFNVYIKTQTRTLYFSELSSSTTQLYLESVKERLTLWQETGKEKKSPLLWKWAWEIQWFCLILEDLNLLWVLPFTDSLCGGGTKQKKRGGKKKWPIL